jgi:hypothetical protein
MDFTAVTFEGYILPYTGLFKNVRYFSKDRNSRENPNKSQIPISFMKKKISPDDK